MEIIRQTQQRIGNECISNTSINYGNGRSLNETSISVGGQPIFGGMRQGGPNMYGPRPPFGGVMQGGPNMYGSQPPFGGFNGGCNDMDGCGDMGFNGGFNDMGFNSGCNNMGFNGGFNGGGFNSGFNGGGFRPVMVPVIGQGFGPIPNRIGGDGFGIGRPDGDVGTIRKIGMGFNLLGMVSNLFGGMNRNNY